MNEAVENISEAIVGCLKSRLKLLSQKRRIYRRPA